MAVLSYRQALREGLGTAKIYARLGMILERDCKPVEAKDAYQRALSLDPDNDDARNALEKISGEL